MASSRCSPPSTSIRIGCGPVEGANGVGRSIAQRLVGFGETVVDVPAKLATRVRVCSTGHGRKTDHSDAVAIARAATRVELVQHLIGVNRRPSGERGFWMWGRVGADSLIDSAFAVLNVATTA